MKNMVYFSVGTTMPVEDMDIMMGTGKKDKQGEEIFEGDILYIVKEEVSERGEFEDRTVKMRCPVIYENGAFLLGESPYVQTYLRELCVDHWTMKECKIIGNIYVPPVE